MAKLNEEVSQDGQKLYVYSSSKDDDLFKYYYSRDVKYGLNAGSAYGFGTYAILSNPIDSKEDAEIGYSDGVRSNLYGDNCYEFTIPTSRVLFFEYEDYIKTPQGSSSSPDNFIREQLDRFGIHLADEEIEALTPDPEEGFSSAAAQAFFRYMSRIYYQNKRGSLNTPVAGFVYKGKNDGRTYVGWDSYALIPTRKYTPENGWVTEDETTDTYKGYVAKSNETRGDWDPFDGNKTKAKEAVYRMFTKYSSADDETQGMAGGVFSNIIIHDDKTVDCKFRSNLPQVDGYKHFLRVTPQDNLLRSLHRIGFKFGRLECGIKIGNEKGSSYKISDIPDYMWPETCSDGLKIGGMQLNTEEMSHIKTAFDGSIYLVGCEIQDDCLDGFDIVVNDKKPNWTTDEATHEELSSVYGSKDWWSSILPSKAAEEKPKRNYKPEVLAKRAAAAAEKEEKERQRAERTRQNWDSHTDKIIKYLEEE